MASLRTSSLLLPHPSSSTSKRNRSIRASIHFPTPASGSMLMEELRLRNSPDYAPLVRRRRESPTVDRAESEQQLYLLLEEVSDRIEMHINIGKQRENWNSLLLNSINMMTLTATTLTGLSATNSGGAETMMPSTLLFGATTAILLVMNKIQPSQLAEEQRNAVRLFKELKSEIESKLAMSATKNQDQVEEMMKKVLALDRAYPLPLLGKMLEKFPKKLEPAVWWPSRSKTAEQKQEDEELLRHFPSAGASYHYERSRRTRTPAECNGWTEELEVEMRAIVLALKSKDEADYLRLGNIALKTNKFLSISGPLLTGFAAAASALSGFSGFAATVASLAGAASVAVNTLEHGGQVGMVVEMYRNCAGFFRLVEESIESTLEEMDFDKRENGDLFERKVALKLGRSLSQLRDFARKSVYSDMEETEVDEFASKLF